MNYRGGSTFIPKILEIQFNDLGETGSQNGKEKNNTGFLPYAMY